MLHPPHLININISYNMPQQKHNKPAPKRNSKTNKNATAMILSQSDIQNKPNRKNVQSAFKKTGETKTAPDGKKTIKKKNNTTIRNTLTPDIFIERRMKTEGPTTEPQVGTTYKKQEKNRAHYRSTQPVLTKSQPKKINANKSTKTVKQGHQSSLLMQGWKKIPAIQFSQHFISQSISAIGKKKRAQSTFAKIDKNDKVVSKLLNISLLASQLGGSRPITSERANNQILQTKTFRECMSSIDMRILRTMHDDVPVFQQRQNRTDYVRNILRSNNISLEELTRKVVMIQRKWRKIHRNIIINTYKNIFEQATNKLTQQDKFDEVSEISPEDREDSQRDLDLFTNQNVAANLKLNLSRGNSRQNSEKQLNYQMRWIEETQKEKQQDGGLNINKYRELVMNTIKQSQSKSKTQSKVNDGVWENINRKVPNSFQQKKGIDSKLLLDQLIRQSNLNKKWIQDDTPPNQYEHQFQNKTSKSSSPIQIDLPFPENQLPQVKNRDFKIQKSQEQDSFGDSQQYDKNKYQPENQIDIRQKQNGEKQPFMTKIETKPQIQAKIKEQEQDIKWMNKSALEDDHIVRSYLDCGLNNFELSYNQRQHNKIQQSQSSDQDVHSPDDSHNFSSDQAIGAKFQKANLAVLRKNKHANENDIKEQKINKGEADRMVEMVIDFLICQFASDISIILKKCTAPVQQRKRMQTIPQILPITQASIEQYVIKLLTYITNDESILQKVIANINKDIGPSSLEILSYLRPQCDDGHVPLQLQNDDQNFDDEDGLFVIPAELFEQFQIKIQLQLKEKYHKQMTGRMKSSLNYWHRCIFQSYNQCLDYQRPFGIEGKPYTWVTQMKFKPNIARKHIQKHLKNAQNKLIEATQLVGGLIFQKPDSPFIGADLNEQQMHMMNEERLSRILAIQLLQNEQSWVNYNDQLAELEVELARMIEEKLFAESSNQIRRLYRRRKALAEENSALQAVVFDLEQL